MKQAIGIGYGKAILFGEHFVVYGLPGIAASVELNTTCAFAQNKNGIISNDLVTGELVRYGENKYKRLDQVLDVVFKETGIKEKNFRLKLTTNMSIKGGMGSSAALGVSIIRCLDQKFRLGLGNERVNEIAYEVEKLFHGNPSGIDNTVSTYGGLLWFVKGKGFEKIKIRKPVEVVLADTGIIHDTGEIVEMVKRNREKEPEKYSEMFAEYEKLALEAREAIEKEDWGTVGKLVGKNHELLQEMGVSCRELDLLVHTAIQSGALGAKLTGAGIGGNMLALTPGKALQESVAKACEKAGFEVCRTKIGVEI